MYEPNVTPFPFWGAETITKTGRDPLAVQNSSVVIYDNMIKGITNVTTRIRYNGFFCWLLTLIAERLEASEINKIDNQKEQIKLVRRGELLLAYSMQYNFPQITDGASGAIYVRRNFNTEKINLARGADIENKPTVYWQNRLGVFGQYYIGVMTQLKLLYMPDASHDTYRVTKDGLRLCNIFRKSLSKQDEDLFWKSIQKGHIAKEDLGRFKSIALHLIDNEEELSEYTKIFCKPDRKDITGREICHRINSIKLLMNYIRKEGAKVERRDMVLSFLKFNFQLVLKKKLKVTEEQLSWFLYELNELSHAAYEAYHFAILYTATDEPQPLDIVLDELESDFKKTRKTRTASMDIYELYDKMLTAYFDDDFGSYLHLASCLLMALYNAIKPYITTLYDYAINEDYDVKHTGFAPSLLIRLVDNHEYNGKWDFVEDNIYSAINDHLRSSYSKSSIGQGIVHNYMVDDGLIWQLRQVEPIRTSPRLQNVLRFIEDIKWIKRSGERYVLTERGMKILQQ